MKKFVIGIFIMLLTTVSNFAYSQNGGQSSQNNVIRLVYLGWSNGFHSIRVINKLNCSTDIRFNGNGAISLFTLAALDSTIRFVPGIQGMPIEVKAKRVGGGNCAAQIDNGWVELEIENGYTVPIRFKSFSGKRIDSQKIQLFFEVEEDASIYHYSVKVSFDGKIFQEVQLVFPNGIQGNKKYSVTLTNK